MIFIDVLTPTNAIARCRGSVSFKMLYPELKLVVRREGLQNWGHPYLPVSQHPGGLFVSWFLPSPIFVQKCMPTSQQEPSFSLVSEDFAYELCVGQNGRVWLSAPTARETVLLLQATDSP